MSYAKAIKICEEINQDNGVSESEKLLAVEKILSLSTHNAVSKKALIEVIRWFYDSCVVEVVENA